MKKRMLKALIACLIVGVVSAGGYWGYVKYFSGSTVTANSYKVVSAQKTNMQIGIQGTGNVYAGISKDVAANNNGVLEDLNVKVGDTVGEGTKLFVSDSDDLKQSLNDAQSNLDKQKLTLQSDTDSYNDSLNNANTAISNAQNLLNNAVDQLNKMTVTSPVSGKVIAINNKNGDEVKGGGGAVSSQSGKFSGKNTGEANVVMIIKDDSNENKKVEIKPNNDGVIKNLSLKVGDSVKTGETLFVVDSDTLRQNVDKAQSNLDKQNSALIDLKNSNRLKIDQLNISDAQIQLDSASEAVNKMTVTAPIGGMVVAVNNNNGDDIQTSSTSGSSQGSSGSSSGQSNGSTSGGSSSGGSSSSGTSSKQTTGSQTNSGQSNGSGSSNQTSSTQTSSTSSSQTTDSIVTIVDPGSVKVKVQVDELDIGKITLGQKAEIKFDSIKDKVFDGQVESIPQTGTTTNNVTKYDVVVSINNPTDIKIGMSANVNILTDSKADALVVPAEAVTEKDGKKYVMVQNSSDSGNTTSTTTAGNLVEVKTGIENEQYIEIVEGINENEKVLAAAAKQ